MKKTGTWIIKVIVPKKAFRNNFTLSAAEVNNAGPLKRRGISDLPFLKTVLAIC